jgi:hypothetical protein
MAYIGLPAFKWNISVQDLYLMETLKPGNHLMGMGDWGGIIGRFELVNGCGWGEVGMSGGLKRGEGMAALKG